MRTFVLRIGATLCGEKIFFTTILLPTIVCATIFGATPGWASPEAPARFADDPDLVVTQRVILRGIDFGFDTAFIQPVSAGTLEVVSGGLRLRPDVRVVVEGHTDSVGSPEYNLALSRERAESVKRIIVGFGVEPERLQTAGLGETKPIAPNDTEAGRTMNRRVELVLYETRIDP